MTYKTASQLSRREFVIGTGLATLATGAGLGAAIAPGQVLAQGREMPRPASGGGRYNILMILTDQEHRLLPNEYPAGYRLPGHERLARSGVTFENHQIASCVCTPSRAVIYTGQHIQNNGVFDNADFPWSDNLSTEIDTIGDMLRRQGYYTAYKGKWHLNDEFETANKLHSPKRLLGDEMEEYGFSDFFGIGDIIAHTQGGYLHDDVIASMARSWLRGRGERLREEKKPWFLAVNLVNPHDVMYYNTDLPGESAQSGTSMFPVNRDPAAAIYRQQWDVQLPKSRNQALDAPGRPPCHREFREARGALVGLVPNEDARWQRLNNYYLNCIRDVDSHVVEILDELESLGMADNTIVIYTSDHGELAGAHGMNGKGANAYRENNNVPFIVAHPAYEGNKRCKAVTSHVDIATTLMSIAGGSVDGLPGKDVSQLLDNPEAASFDALRDGALYNFNMFAYVDADFLNNIRNHFAQGGKPEELAEKGWRPNLKKRGAIRSVYDGRYKLSRYFAPMEHHVPRTMEELFANNDVELFDVVNDPIEMNNLAVDRRKHGDLIEMMNDKLNLLIAQEVGDDIGQMLPGGTDADWKLSPDLKNLRM